LIGLFQCIFKVLGTVILVSWLNPWSFIPAMISVIGMIFIRYRFARCLRDLKRIEGISRSRWAAIRFDWITIIFIALVTILAMLVRVVQNHLSTSDIALILSYSLNLMGTLQWTIR
jgi:hypothetical protein